MTNVKNKDQINYSYSLKFLYEIGFSASSINLSKWKYHSMVVSILTGLDSLDSQVTKTTYFLIWLNPIQFH